MVVGVDVVIVWHHRRQELGTGEAEQLLKHLQVSEMEKGTCVATVTDSVLQTSTRHPV